MSDNTLLQRLTSDLGPRVKALEKDNEAAKPAMQDVINQLSDAIRALDQPLIRRHAKTLEGQVGAYASLVTRAEKVVGDLGAIDTDDAETLKRLVPLTEQASTSLKKIKANYEKLKEMLSMAHAKAADPAIAAVEKQWAEMESWMTTQRTLLGTRVKQMDVLLELARSSAADGDDKSLAQAQDKAKERATWKPTQREVGEKFTNFMSICEKALGKNLQDELKRDILKWKAMVSEFADMNDKLDRGVETLRNIKMAPPKPLKLDFGKAAALVGVDEGDLKKAWGNGPADPEKALNGVAKNATKLKAKTGKEMVAALRKAKLLPP